MEYNPGSRDPLVDVDSNIMRANLKRRAVTATALLMASMLAVVTLFELNIDNWLFYVTLLAPGYGVYLTKKALDLALRRQAFLVRVICWDNSYLGQLLDDLSKGDSEQRKHALSILRVLMASPSAPTRM